MIESFGILQVAHAPVRATPHDTSEMVTQLLFGESFEILERENSWLYIRCNHDSYPGWIDQKQSFLCSEDVLKNWHRQATKRQTQPILEYNTKEGRSFLYKGSVLPFNFQDGFDLGSNFFQPSNHEDSSENKSTLLDHAKSYLNVPYLWGGRSYTGIDCSGFTQMVYAFNKTELPRDASQQVLLGTLIKFEEIQAGDLAFFRNANGKIIHVGILTGLGTILHAHGKVTEDVIKMDGIYKKDDLYKSHDLACIKRI